LAAVATRSVEENSEENPLPEGEAGDSTTGESRLVLFGDSDFASNGYFNSVANGDLFLMTIGWLAEEADLVAIRTKEVEDRRINLTFSQSRWVFWVTVVFFPLATLILGTTVWNRRRASTH
jgi:ABC-type uncharacterized transport system involved in gliding motility auxiliary subunit